MAWFGASQIADVSLSFHRLCLWECLQEQLPAMIGAPAPANSGGPPMAVAVVGPVRTLMVPGAFAY